jgi:hypothetical protein
MGLRVVVFGAVGQAAPIERPIVDEAATLADNQNQIASGHREGRLAAGQQGVLMHWHTLASDKFHGIGRATQGA